MRTCYILGLRSMVGPWYSSLHSMSASPAAQAAPAPRLGRRERRDPAAPGGGVGLAKAGRFWCGALGGDDMAELCLGNNIGFVAWSVTFGRFSLMLFP